MENNWTSNLITEVQKPKRILLKNDTVLFVVVAVGAVFIGTCFSYICTVTGIPYLWFSLFLYAFFGFIVVWLYRSALVTYRYTISDRMITAVRQTGKKTRPAAQAHLSDIVSVVRYRGVGTDGKASKAGHGRKEGMLLIRYKNGKSTDGFLISVGDAFENELIARVKQAKK